MTPVKYNPERLHVVLLAPVFAWLWLALGRRNADFRSNRKLRAGVHVHRLGTGSLQADGKARQARCVGEQHVENRVLTCKHGLSAP